MSRAQSAILAPVPSFGRFIELDLLPSRDPRPALDRLKALAVSSAVVGLGAPLLSSLGATVPGLRAFPALTGAGSAFPSTPRALWLFVGASQMGDVIDRTDALLAATADAFVLREEVATFKYQDGRDLTGYEDGTENPVDEAAVAAAIVSGAGAGIDGSSMVAVQRYLHDLPRFRAMPAAARDHVIGRRHTDNEELDDAPASAHVKRAAQESFEPPAFMLRRSMPWSEGRSAGLYFVAFGRSFDAFEQISRRMLGLDDGVVDALFSFTRPITGGYFWCPPTLGDVLDLSRIGL